MPSEKGVESEKLSVAKQDGKIFLERIEALNVSPFSSEINPNPMPD